MGKRLDKVFSSFGYVRAQNNHGVQVKSIPSGLTKIQNAILADQWNSTNPYFKIWVVQTCVDLIANGAASLPVTLRNDEGEPQKIKENRVSSLILNKPNNIEDGSELVVRQISDLILFGNSYTHVLGGANRPIELTPLNPRNITPEMVDVNGMAVFGNRDDIVSGDVVYRDFSKNMTFLSKDIIHVKTYNPNSRIIGLPVLTSAFSKLLRIDKLEEYSNSIMENGVFPSTYFYTDMELTEQQRQNFAMYLREEVQGAKNAGNPLFADLGMKMQTMSFSPSDMDVLNNEKITAGNIATQLGVPPEMLGNLIENPNRATYQETVKQLLTNAIIPKRKAILNKQNAYFFPDGKLSIEINENQIKALQPPTDMVKDAYWFTPNQKAVMQGGTRSDDPNMDKIYIPSGLQLLEEAAFDGDGENL